jgi:hypothetical protein
MAFVEKQQHLVEVHVERTDTPNSNHTCMSYTLIKEETTPTPLPLIDTFSAEDCPYEEYYYRWCPIVMFIEFVISILIGVGTIAIMAFYLHLQNHPFILFLAAIIVMCISLYAFHCYFEHYVKTVRHSAQDYERELKKRWNIENSGAKDSLNNYLQCVHRHIFERTYSIVTLKIDSVNQRLIAVLRSDASIETREAVKKKLWYFAHVELEGTPVVATLLV